jgi:hypothetical protein
MATVKKTPQKTSAVKKQTKKAPVTKKATVKSKATKAKAVKPKTLVGKVHHHIKRVFQAGNVKIFVLSAVLLVLAVGGVAAYQKFGAKAAVTAACVNVAPNAKVYTNTVTWSSAVTVSNGMLCATSSDKQSALVYQKDGNLVWYVKSKARWASNTGGAGSKLYLQADGNVVIKNKNNQVVYAASTGDPTFAAAKPSNWKNIDVLKNSNFYSVAHNVTPDPSADKVTRVRYSTLNYMLSDMGSDTACADKGTFSWDIGREAGPGQFCVTESQGSGKGAKFVFQKDGNLVFYDAQGSAVWSSQTGGRGTKLAFQKDANVVVYDAANKAVWALSWGGGACNGRGIWGNIGGSFKAMDFVGRSNAYGTITFPAAKTMWINIEDALNPRIGAVFQSDSPLCSR